MQRLGPAMVAASPGRPAASGDGGFTVALQAKKRLSSHRERWVMPGSEQQAARHAEARDAKAGDPSARGDPGRAARRARAPAARAEGIHWPRARRLHAALVGRRERFALRGSTKQSRTTARSPYAAP